MILETDRPILRKSIPADLSGFGKFKEEYAGEFPLEEAEFAVIEKKSVRYLTDTTDSGTRNRSRPMNFYRVIAGRLGKGVRNGSRGGNA